MEKFGVERSPDHVKHHLRTVKSAWNIRDQLRNKSRFGWDENMNMVTASPTVFSTYVQAHPSHEKYLNKKIEMFDEMVLIVGKDRANRCFAKSFGDINLELSAEDALNDAIDVTDISKDKEVEKRTSSATSTQPRQHCKRSRDTCDEESDLKIIFEKLRDVVDVISRLTGD